MSTAKVTVKVLKVNPAATWHHTGVNLTQTENCELCERPSVDQDGVILLHECGAQFHDGCYQTYAARAKESTCSACPEKSSVARVALYRGE